MSVQAITVVAGDCRPISHDGGATTMTDKPEITRVEQPEGEMRSLGQVGAQFLDSGVTGAGLMAGGLVMKDAYGKIKDVVAPKDEGPKVELPPGVDQ
jgi:hypothetical protein